MRAVKVLNNSLVLAIDDDGTEIILMGKGIGYHKAIGYEFGDEEIEKVFVLENQEVSRRILQLAAETSAVYFDLAKEIIGYAKSRYHMELMDHIYLSLTDHLAFTAKRAKEGITFQNFYTPEMKEFNPEEYSVGEYAVQRMSQELGMEIPSAEAGNIAWHFINAETGSHDSINRVAIAATTEDILNIVRYTFGITYRKDTIAWSRYLTHVQLFAERLVTGTLLPEESDHMLYEQLQQTCRKEFMCVDRIRVYVEEKFRQKLSSQEQMYLAIHLHRILSDVIASEEDNPG